MGTQKKKILKADTTRAPFSPQDKFEIRNGDERFGEHPLDYIITDRDHPIAKCFTKTYANLLGAAPELLAMLKRLATISTMDAAWDAEIVALIDKVEGRK